MGVITLISKKIFFTCSHTVIVDFGFALYFFQCLVEITGQQVSLYFILVSCFCQTDRQMELITKGNCIVSELSHIKQKSVTYYSKKPYMMNNLNISLLIETKTN